MSIKQTSDSGLNYVAENVANKSQPGGYASLGIDGKIPSSELSPIAITNTFVVASEAEQIDPDLGAEIGDLAIRTDQSKSYVHNGGAAGTMSDWTELLTPTSPVLSVNGKTGTITLTTADIADFTDKRYITDAQLVIIGNTSGTNTGDETTNTIKTKLGTATLTTDGYLTSTDFNYFTNKKSYHGVLSRPVGASNPLPSLITTTTFTLGATTNPITYYFQGTKVVVNSDKTAILDDGVGGSSAGLYFVCFDGITGNITATKIYPGFGYNSNITIATIYWNGTNLGLVSDERHSYLRNTESHVWSHATIGTRYGSGITLTHNSGTGNAATFATTSGDIWDEDIQFTISASSSFPTPNTCRLFYQTGISSYAFVSSVSTVPGYLGPNQRPYVVNSTGYVLTEVPSASDRFINVFVYATTNLHTPIHMFVETVTNTIAGQGGYTSLANARAVPFPNLSGFNLSQEMKPIYRLIWRADGVLQAINTTQDDYRTVSSLPMSAGNVSTTASSISFIPYGNISSSTVQTAIQELDDEKASLNGAETLTNKRNTRRVDTQTSTASITPEISTYDIFIRTTQASALVINNHSTSTPVDGDMMLFQILGDATPRAISYGDKYAALYGTALPTTTVANKNLAMLFIWRNDLSKWGLLSAGNEA